jgi:hypothetical protein
MKAGERRRALRLGIVGAALIGPAALLAYRPDLVPAEARAFVYRARGRATVASRLRQYGPTVRARLAPDFRRAGVTYPPRRVLLAAFKQERRLEVYAAGSATSGPLRFIRSYEVLGASGTLGPKLAEGDGQVPEGFYRVESLNPNSQYHLALRLDYPNADDRAQGRRDGRKRLGSDIMIHGNIGSIGCLAMGDPASEDLFVLAAEARAENVRVLIAPVDFRRGDVPADAKRPAWVTARYADLRRAVRVLPAAGQ